MENQPEIVTWALGPLDRIWSVAQGWMVSPAAWSQFALLSAAWLLAVLLSRVLRPMLAGLLTPPEASASPLSRARRFVLMFLPLLLPLMAYALAVLGGAIGVGIGLGRQKIASNYISGLILLLEG